MVCTYTGLEAAHVWSLSLRSKGKLINKFNQLFILLCINHLTCMTSTLMFLFAVLDLLAYGSDTVTIHQLFKVASALDPNLVHHTSLNDLVASLRRNNMGTFINGMTRGSNASRRVQMSASRGMDIPIGALNSMYIFQLVMYVWFSVI